jgi:hypothetical protein
MSSTRAKNPPQLHRFSSLILLTAALLATFPGPLGCTGSASTGWVRGRPR